jgi:hypothetical protein
MLNVVVVNVIVLIVVMLSVVMLNVVILSVVMLNVVMPSVVAPSVPHGQTYLNSASLDHLLCGLNLLLNLKMFSTKVIFGGLPIPVNGTARFF